MNRKIPHFHLIFLLKLFYGSFVFRSLNYYYYYGAIFLFWDNFSPESGTTFDLLAIFGSFLFLPDTDFCFFLLSFVLHTVFNFFALFCSRKLRISVPLGEEKMVINFNHFK